MTLVILREQGDRRLSRVIGNLTISASASIVPLWARLRGLKEWQTDPCVIGMILVVEISSCLLSAPN